MQKLTIKPNLAVFISGKRSDNVYIAGGITGVEDYKSKFAAVAEKLRSKGKNPCNPAEIDLGEGAEWEDYMRVCIPILCQCGTIVMLNNWEESRGAKMELRIALELGIRVKWEGYI